ncbi:MAG: selenium cofactor biosynthesis protein YqeC [Planctomycetota bacterium]|jgi:probable selenium-dependent hydroxylase accessory protein YqeC|nr:selenium cofactor biosynthesis protein YqeC [Planctomycetota bacterium]MDP7249960.1 selenium cofactor biosynthesis protein YqeC [Planctomycetota bacterium]
MTQSIIELLKIGRGSFVSVIGAGGKSTLLTHIADECTASDLRVLISSTTNMQPPPPEETDEFLVRQPGEDILERLKRSFDKHQQVTAAGASISSPDSEGRTRRDKIKGFEPEEMDAIHANGPQDILLIQADGARRRSFKAPAPHEPRVPSRTTHCILSVGLDVLGVPLDSEKVHRHEITAALAGQTIGSEVTIDTILKVSQHPDGYLPRLPPNARRFLYLSKADTPERIESARFIQSSIDPEKYEMVFWANLTGD